jgi:hypothetical protein
MNRHERRKAEAGTRVDKAFDIDIVGGGAIFGRAEFIQAALTWAQHIKATQPVCIHCLHSWTALAQQPPAAFVFIRPWQQPVLNNWHISAICNHCINLPDLRERCLAAIRKHWPDKRVVMVHHSGSEAVQ